METAEEEDFGSSSISIIRLDCCEVWIHKSSLARSWLWNTLEYPWTSNLAQFLAFFSLSMIVLSTITFIISTADELQKGPMPLLKIYLLNLEIFLDENGTLEFPLIVYLIELLDNFVTIFFSAEFITRLIICPRNSVLFKNIKTNNIKQNILNLYNWDDEVSNSLQSIFILLLQENEIFEKVNEYCGSPGNCSLLHFIAAG